METSSAPSLKRRCPGCGEYLPARAACARCTASGQTAPRPLTATASTDAAARAPDAAFGDWSRDRRLSTDVRARLEDADADALVAGAKPVLLMPRIGSSPRRRTATVEVTFDDPGDAALGGGSPAAWVPLIALFGACVVGAMLLALL